MLASKNIFALFGQRVINNCTTLTSKQKYFPQFDVSRRCRSYLEKESIAGLQIQRASCTGTEISKEILGGIDQSINPRRVHLMPIINSLVNTRIPKYTPLDSWNPLGRIQQHILSLRPGSFPCFPTFSGTSHVRTLTQVSRIKGKKITVRDVVKRFYRLDWGTWIRPRSGRHRKVYRKTTAERKRAATHVFCNANQSRMLDKMVGKYWRTKKFYVDDPYESYHKRENFHLTRYF